MSESVSTARSDDSGVQIVF